MGPLFMINTDAAKDVVLKKKKMRSTSQSKMPARNNQGAVFVTTRSAQLIQVLKTDLQPPMNES